ncbi:MAG: 1,4-dihydroxy-2-naphthoate polyprenyltransferase [Psychromonas sp.]|nr:1,4-dihydroxy-2-naphthoate polyprenyltransferase [Psychromonas sp.]
MTTKHSIFSIYLQAIRPKTLSASVAPCLIASGLAIHEQPLNIFLALTCILTAMLLQIGCNLSNDYFDFIKGTDGDDRLGPTRVTQAGLLSPQHVKWAFVFCFVLAAVGVAILTYYAGWIIAVIGVLGVVTAIAYTAGENALAYVGLGDVAAFIFFGPVTVVSMYYIQTGMVSQLSIIASIAPGLLCIAILSVNNLRDIQSDARANKRTLAVRYGATFTRIEYTLCLLLSAIIPLFIFLTTDSNVIILLPILSIFLAIPVLKTVWQQEGRVLNIALGQTGGILLVYSILATISYVFR